MGKQHLEFFEQYHRRTVDPTWVTALEFFVAGLPLALYCGQLFSDVEASILGCKCIVLFALTGLIRHGCGWTLTPTALATLMALTPIIVFTLHLAGFGTPPETWPDGWDY